MNFYNPPLPLVFPNRNQGAHWYTFASQAAAGASGVSVLVNNTSFGNAISLRALGATDTAAAPPLLTTVQNNAQALFHTQVDASVNFALYANNNLNASMGAYLLADWGNEVVWFDPPILLSSAQTVAPTVVSVASYMPAGRTAIAAYVESGAGAGFTVGLPGTIGTTGNTNLWSTGATLGASQYISPLDGTQSFAFRVSTANANAVYLRAAWTAGFTWLTPTVDASASVAVAAPTLNNLPVTPGAVGYLYLTGNWSPNVAAYWSLGAGAGTTPTDRLLQPGSLQYLAAAPPQIASGTVNLSWYGLGVFTPLATPMPRWNRGRVNIMTTDQNVPPNPPPVTPAFEITTTSLPAGQVGAPYSQQLAATGASGAVTWSEDAGSAANWGDALQLSPSGVLSGTPQMVVNSTTNPQLMSITFRATDAANNTATKTLTITVAPQ